MKEDVDAIERNETWELVDLQISCDAFGVKWIYRLKYNHDGSVKKTQSKIGSKRICSTLCCSLFLDIFSCSKV